MKMVINWHTLSAEESLAKSGTNAGGLDDAAAKQRLSEYGKNELIARKRAHPLFIFFRQFFDLMILILVIAAIISAFIGDKSDTIVIIIIVLLNAVIGFVQEYRAEKAMDALKKMTPSVSRVLRNKETVELSSSELVPGDIVLLEAGDTIPADMRLLENHSLKANESSLTGESNAVDKTTDALKEENLPLGDRHNMAFKGTHIINGRGQGLVVATGMQTELGKIAGMLDEAESTTPLQKRLTDFTRKLTFIIILLCIAFFFTGYLSGKELNIMLLTAISLAVAAIPEALPAVVTVSLALGSRKLVKQQALIRKLYAVETLGSVTFICTDKTGTLTKNEMTVHEVSTPDENRKTELLLAMSLNHDIKKKNGKLSGDPTELAMAAYAKEQDELKRMDEIPFDSERKVMTTIHERDGKYWVITKGAPESIAIIIAGNDEKEVIKKQAAKMAQDGMRVIGFAGKEISQIPTDISPATIEKDLEFIGLAGLLDPPREEAKEAITQCKNAGIVPVMITGDHPLTAASIARQIGILGKENGEVAEGKDLDEEAISEKAEKIRVYARVSPEQKLKIVEALQQKGQFVAMTGDGVNDAPSLKKANIGIAMGITGTDVAKEASHMILLDDNFATIIKAVRVGRNIYDNIRKFIRYILTGNTAEIMTILAAPLIGLPMPLLPVHILWINLVTDGLPALALSAERSEKDSMKRPPRNPDESIFAHGLGWHVLWVGFLISVLTICTQWFSLSTHTQHWQTMVFTVLCFCQLWHVMAIRSDKESLFSMGLLSNKPLLLAVVATVLLQLGVIYIPYLNTYFHTTPLTIAELFLTIGISSIVFIAVEIEKWLKRMRGSKNKTPLS